MPLPDYETLTVEKAGVYLRVLLNRPEQRNAINQRMSGELNDMLDRVGSMEDVRAVVLRGAAAVHFDPLFGGVENVGNLPRGELGDADQVAMAKGIAAGRIVAGGSDR